MQLWLPFFVIFLYAVSGTAFWRTARRGLSVLPPLAILFAACQSHALLLIHTVGMTGSQAWNLSIFNVISIFAWTLACLSFFWLWKREMALGGVMIAGINSAIVLLSALLHSKKPFLEALSGGIIWHILCSIAAWTVLSIALVHGILYLTIFQRLKRKKLKGIPMASLANIERVMMLITAIGFALLLASLFSGWLFVENLFAQHLVHKTLFTMASAAVYGWTLVLFYGKHQRGAAAVYWSFCGYALLMMGYVISNIVLQFLLHRG